MEEPFARHRILLLTLLLLSAPAVRATDNSAYVDPSIGSVAKLLVPTYPTYHLPNQMIRMMPISDNYIDDQITAFPLQVTEHRSWGIMQMRVSTGEITRDAWDRRMTRDQDLEVRHPWQFSTYLIDDDITVGFVPGRTCAMYRIEFPAGGRKNLLIRGADRLQGAALGGSRFGLEETIRYTTRGIEPVTRVMAAYCYAQLTDVEGKSVSGVTFEPGPSRFAISLNADAPATVLLKYAISYVSVEQARENFLAEVGSRGFEEMTRQGKAAWDEALGKITVEGGTDAQKRTFYTALYRTYERMVNINEGGRYYSGYDAKVHESDRPFYVDDWVWDTYLADHPLRILINPVGEADMLNSYTLMYEQSGWMPTFPEVHGNHQCMNCFHSSAIFLDAHRKGIAGYDVEKAYEGIRKNVTEATMLPWRQGLPKRPIDDFYHEHGYMPALRPGEKETEPMVDRWEKRQAVAVTLGMSFDSWVLSQLAKELGKADDQEKFARMALNYRNLWDPEKRLFMPKDEQGQWIKINPKLDGGPGGRDYYDENNGWTYAWQVQHDIGGLISLLGGKPQAQARLDQLFREPLDESPFGFQAVFPDSTGMVGQFSMGNEPSFHIPYLYNFFGAPWKTQKRIRLLLDVWFTDTLFGIPGDEDGGGMSAFVVFSQMGFYPVVPGLPYYTIGSPVFEKVTIPLQNGKVFTVLAPGASKENKYIDRAFLNDKELEGPFFTHEDLMKGATLRLIMTNKPNKTWGSEAKPPMP
jgi:predicted alpha-1,2-mannosidase